MPIVLTRPQPDDPFGPGFLFQASTDLIGPLPPGTFWLFELQSATDENTFAAMRVNSNASSVQGVFTNGTNTLAFYTWASAETVHGAAGLLRVSLTEPGPTEVENLTVAVTIDRQSGVTADLSRFIEDRLAAQPVGLTTEQGEQLNIVQAAVTAAAPINPIDFIGDLAQAFRTQPPLSFGSLSATYDLIGDGEMPDVGDLLHTKLGIFFTADIPAGLSHRHGQSEEYPARLIQWRTVHLVGGVELVTEVVDFITHGELWKWSVAKPLRIEYSVLPSVVVHARWWQFP